MYYIICKDNRTTTSSLVIFQNGKDRTMDSSIAKKYSPVTIEEMEIPIVESKIEYLNFLHSNNDARVAIREDKLVSIFGQPQSVFVLN